MIKPVSGYLLWNQCYPQYHRRLQADPGAWLVQQVWPGLFLLNHRRDPLVAQSEFLQVHLQQ